MGATPLKWGHDMFDKIVTDETTPTEETTPTSKEEGTVLVEETETRYIQIIF